MRCEGGSRRFETFLVKGDVVGAYTTLNKGASGIMHYNVGMEIYVLNALECPWSVLANV
jgi:hypothetical protein